jgi:hypothetical protein
MNKDLHGFPGQGTPGMSLSGKPLEQPTSNPYDRECGHTGQLGPCKDCEIERLRAALEASERKLNDWHKAEAKFYGIEPEDVPGAEYGDRRSAVQTLMYQNRMLREQLKLAGTADETTERI